MKKKISLLAAILILAICFTGCSKAGTISKSDTDAMKQQAETIVSSFASMSKQELDSFKDVDELQLDITLLQTGFKVKADDFVTMVEAWEAGIKECGAYQGHDEFRAEESSDSVMLVADAQYKNRDAEITIEFSRDGEMKSFTAAAEYTTGEILKKAGLNTLLGMGTVFAVLIFISFIISLFGLIGKNQQKKGETAKKEEMVKTEETESVMEEDVTDDLELVAVISAAIAASEGTSTDGFVVRSIKKRRKNSHWK